LREAPFSPISGTNIGHKLHLRNFFCDMSSTSVEQAVAGRAVARRAGNSACHETRLFPTILRISKNIKIADGGLVTMTDEAQSEILGNNPIGKGLDAFRTSFN
jgi:hypothetical protein